MNWTLNKKTFTSLSNTSNGDISPETIFDYYQQGEIIWADYSGGDITKGSLIGKVYDEETIIFNYQHICKNGELKAGNCKSVICVLDSGKIKLKEKWQWFTGDKTKGYSELEEKN